MKKAILSLVVVASMACGLKAETWRELFKETEGTLIDIAIASSIDVVYYRDLINGRNAVGGQLPILYFADVISADFGYISAYEDTQRGSLAFGGSIRVNKIIEKTWPEKVSYIKEAFPLIGKTWNSLFFGPFIAHNFTQAELSAGIKAGLQW